MLQKENIKNKNPDSGAGCSVYPRVYTRVYPRGIGLP